MSSISNGMISGNASSHVQVSRDSKQTILHKIEEEQASSELTSGTQQSLGNGREQVAVDETLGMADDQPRANIVTANEPNIMPEVDVQENSNGCSAWILKASRGFFEWHDLILTILMLTLSLGLVTLDALNLNM